MAFILLTVPAIYKCRQHGRRHATVRLCAAMVLGLPFGVVFSGDASAANCKGTIYLTFDTGSQSQAELVAATLRRHQIKATFFLANEQILQGE